MNDIQLEVVSRTQVKRGFVLLVHFLAFACLMLHRWMLSSVPNTR